MAYVRALADGRSPGLRIAAEGSVFFPFAESKVNAPTAWGIRDQGTVESQNLAARDNHNPKESEEFENLVPWYSNQNSRNPGASQSGSLG
jgi:hypothetical protein